MNSSIACRYPRFDSGERRLFNTALLLWFRSGSPSFVFGRLRFPDLRVASLLIPTASFSGWGRAYAGGRERLGRYTPTWTTSALPVIGSKPAVTARIGGYIVRTARKRVLPSATRS